MTNWIYNKGNSSIRCLNKGQMDTVMYVDDVNPDVIDRIVKMYNAGKNTKEIEQYLLNEELCTQDEREFIMENIVNYINLTDKMENQNQNQEQNQFPDNLDQVAVQTRTQVPPVEQEKKEETKEKRVYQRRVTDNRSSFKAQSAEDFIKVMQEKIEMAKMIDSVTLPDIPASMTKSNRDIMVEFQKEHNALVTKFMERIQKA
ncbi:MAG: hypothetical protein RLZZ196_1814 [Bacteroidota bacterium]